MKTNPTKASHLVICAIRRQASVIANGLYAPEHDEIKNAELAKLHARQVYEDKTRQADMITRGVIRRAFSTNT